MKKFFGTSLVLGLAASALMAQTGLNFGSLPLWFEADRSPTEAGPRYLARTGNSQFEIAPTGATITLRQASGQTAACTMQFVHGNPAATVTGAAELAGKINYLTGNNPAAWQTSVATFGQVRVEEVYPGINVVYYGNAQQLEYDFNLAAGVDPRTIAIHFDGAEKIAVNGHGELVVSLPGGEVKQHQPVIYQLAGTVRREISGGYKMMDAQTVAFQVGNYDHSLPLVIDPFLSFSTYFGGNDWEIGRAIAVDNSGNIYVAGQTLSKTFTNVPAGAQTGSFKGGAGTGDAFVAKLNPTNANPLVFLTYFGGSIDEFATAIAVDTNHNNNIFITGATDSPDFPNTNAIFKQIRSKYISSGNFYYGDAFVTVLTNNGSEFVYSTYLGGYGEDQGTGIAVDAAGNAYVTGWTSSTNLLVMNSVPPNVWWQQNMLCTNSIYFNANAFVAEIAAGGTELKYYSYFGGTNYDKATGIALDKDNNIYVTGYTASTNFPILNSIVTATKHYDHLNGSTTNTSAFDGFVAKFGPGFTNLIYSTFLGGTNQDVANGIAVDGAGNAYIVGGTISTNFPVINPPSGLGTSYVTTNTTGSYWTTNAFLTQVKFDAATTNTSIGFSTVFGGYWNASGNYIVDIARGVALDSAGDIFVVGSTTSTNFPVTRATISGSLRATNAGLSDVFVMEFAPQGTNLLFSGYIGGQSDDLAYGIAVDAKEDAYVTGQTISTDFPTLKAWQSKLNGSSDAFVTRIQSTGNPVLLAKADGTNVVLFWQPTPHVPQALNLEISTNLMTTNWVTITNQAPVSTNGVYSYTFTPSNPASFFRFQSYTNN